MVATLVEKNNNWICNNCMMKQQSLECTCWFCGRTFSNYEEILTKQSPPEIIIGGRWWEEPEEELTDEQDELLDRLHKIIKEGKFKNEGNNYGEDRKENGIFPKDVLP